MMSPLSQRELGPTRSTCITTLVPDPMVDELAAGLVGHRPAPHAPLGVANVHHAVVPEMGYEI